MGLLTNDAPLPQYKHLRPTMNREDLPESLTEVFLL